MQGYARFVGPGGARSSEKGRGVFPVGDENPTWYTPLVTRTLVVVNLAVFVFQILADSAFTLRWSFVPLELTALLEGRGHPGVVVTMFTAMFLHGSLAHLVGNLLFLWIFGDNIEDQLGHVGYLIFYLLCGIAATITQYVTGPLSAIPNLGASGAISGVLGAYMLLYPGARVQVFIWPLSLFFGTVGVPALIWLGVWFLMQLFLGVQDLGRMAEGGVAFWAHVGGFVAGLVLILVMPRRHPPIRHPSETTWR